MEVSTSSTQEEVPPPIMVSELPDHMLSEQEVISEQPLEPPPPQVQLVIICQNIHSHYALTMMC